MKKPKRAEEWEESPLVSSKDFDAEFEDLDEEIIELDDEIIELTANGLKMMRNRPLMWKSWMRNTSWT